LVFQKQRVLRFVPDSHLICCGRAAAPSLFVAD